MKLGRYNKISLVNTIRDQAYYGYGFFNIERGVVTHRST